MAATASADRSATLSEAELEVSQLADLADAEIAARAYSYWEARGFQGGTSHEDWDRAIRELQAERNRK